MAISCVFNHVAEHLNRTFVLCPPTSSHPGAPPEPAQPRVAKQGRQGSVHYGVMNFLFLLAFLVASSASATRHPQHYNSTDCTFYVSYAVGSDASPGTSASAPFKTILQGVRAAKASTAGKTVCLRADGVHYTAGTIALVDAAGSQSTPLRIIGHPASILCDVCDLDV